jgi:hypothetical protein
LTFYCRASFFMVHREPARRCSRVLLLRVRMPRS